jgi:hypothetical protein
MALSAYWYDKQMIKIIVNNVLFSFYFYDFFRHGLHAGYYLSMLTTSPCILAENLMEKGFKQVYMNPRYERVYNFCSWLFRTRQFDYMSIGFILLNYEMTIKYWKSVYFIGHVVCLVFILIGYSLRRTSKKHRRHQHHQDNKEKSETEKILEKKDH